MPEKHAKKQAAAAPTTAAAEPIPFGSREDQVERPSPGAATTAPEDLKKD